MEEDGRAALQAPCRAFGGVQGGTAGERAPRPPLLLESLAGPGSDDGFDDGYPAADAEQDFDIHARMRASDEPWRAALEA